MVMFHLKFEPNSYCLVEHHYFTTFSFEPVTTETGRNYFIDECNKKLKTLLIVSDNTKILTD